MASKTVKKKTIEFNFSEKHKEYIRRCHECSYNVAEGAVRAGKTDGCLCLTVIKERYAHRNTTANREVVLQLIAPSVTVH